MFEKRHDVIWCWAITGARRICLAPGRGTVTQAAPSRSLRESSAVWSSRRPTTQGSRVSPQRSQRNAPPAHCPARARALAASATVDSCSPLSPTSTFPAQRGSALPRALAPGADTQIRRRLVRAVRDRRRAGHHASGDAGQSGSGHLSARALCRSPSPNSSVTARSTRTPASPTSRRAR